ncbi:hypothetical protein [Nocardia sp. NPDC046763]|uniref:WD40 repeat domain-containing protein n=1 Tax=Nocardia sp. NPDC046763 TaxID=3155256 RepID=UPI0033FE3F2B
MRLSVAVVPQVAVGIAATVVLSKDKDSGAPDSSPGVKGATGGIAPQAGDEVHRVAFSPDGRTLAGAYYWASGNNEVWLWDVATRAKLSDPLAGHTSPVRSLAFAPNGSQLASGSMDHTARLWTMPRPR